MDVFALLRLTIVFMRHSRILCISCLLGLSWLPIYDPSCDAYAATQAHQQQKKSSTREKARVEGQKANVEQKLHTLKAELLAKEAKSEEASQALQKADLAISKANKKLRSLREDKHQVEKELQRLQLDSSHIAKDLTEATQLIEQISKAQFVNSRRSSWQSLINGRNPSELSTDKAILMYLAQKQNRAISLLEDRKSTVQLLSERHQKQHQELARIQQEEEAERTELLKEKRDRQQAFGRLQSEIRTDQARLDKLKKDQARLSALVASIDAKIAQEQRAQEEAAKRKAIRRPNKNSQNASYTPQVGNFGRLKGHLTPPVKGKIVGQFGQERRDQAGATWQGLKIHAKEGTDVVACASGKVVFSDWLRGFGNLLIIDHGNTYMSVYANNESLFKNIGDRVKQGETISSVGTSGGLGEPGLYFEIRYKGKPINPKPWLKP